MMQMSYSYARAVLRKIHHSTEIIVFLMTFHTQKTLKNYISSVKKSFSRRPQNGISAINHTTFHHITLFSISVTKSAVSSFLHNSSLQNLPFITARFQCTFSFITANCVHYCTLNQGLPYAIRGKMSPS